MFNIQQQNTSKFEFDDRYLEHILEKVYDRETGTFLFDCEADLVANQAALFTSSAFDDCESYITNGNVEIGELRANAVESRPMWAWWGKWL